MFNVNTIFSQKVYALLNEKTMKKAQEMKNQKAWQLDWFNLGSEIERVPAAASGTLPTFCIFDTPQAQNMQILLAWK